MHQPLPYNLLNKAPSEILQLLLDNTKEIFIVVDRALNLVTFNREADKAIKRYLHKTLVSGKSILDYSEKERIEDLRKMYAEIFEGVSKKYKYPFKNDLIYELNYQPVFEDGFVQYILITCTDISAQEQALYQATTSQQLLKRAESIARLGSWEWDIETGKVFWSDEFYRMMGLEPGEGIPTKEYGFSFLHKDDLLTAEKTLLHSFNTGDPYSTELRIITKQGDVKVILCQGIIIRNASGWNEKFIGTFLDITNKKLLEESLKKQEQRFQSLIENSADLIMQINQERLITYASPSLISMMLYEQEDVIGKRLKTFAHPQDLSNMLQAFEKMVAEPGIPLIAEYRVIRKDGSLLWVEGTITNLLHIPGVNSIVLNQRDISQRKEAERLVTKLNETLRSRASELFTSNIELERFAYIASHDLQEPLRMITSFLKLLEKKYIGQLDEKATQYIHFAVDGAERMKQLINDLLEYSRAGNKKGMSKVNMTEVAGNVTTIFKNAIEESNAVIKYDDLPDVVGEKTQLVQMLQNLVGNALKYRGNERPVITIKGLQKSGKWVFSVEDNGIGIAEKNADEIFNIFQRLHAKDQYEGTGIGLAICRKIAEAHGGKIWMKPAENQGSIFYFTIKK